ncbi:359_t:CDS:2 [Ambispora leptoticha]|uniref:359_t:CDS:1 n=1 Tax=Ambispora leptoticha TaxID=144679 RepID=A0A9N9F1X9_9GLOM|nr:359_t:CDS:2 [Ambispora leptoticha]
METKNDASQDLLLKKEERTEEDNSDNTGVYAKKGTNQERLLNLWGRNDQEAPYTPPYNNNNNGGGNSSNANNNYDGSYRDYRPSYGRRHTYDRYEQDKTLEDYKKGGDEMTVGGEHPQRSQEKPPTPEFITTTDTEITATPSTEPETSDPAKLNEKNKDDDAKVSPPIIKAFHTGKPNGKRLLLRFVQFLSSAGAFGFIVGAPIYSGESTPFNDKFAVICLYIISVVSALTSLYFLAIYCIRRSNRGDKIKQWILLIVDLFFAIVWGADVMILIGTDHCSPGDHNHW